MLSSLIEDIYMMFPVLCISIESNCFVIFFFFFFWGDKIKILDYFLVAFTVLVNSIRVCLHLYLMVYSYVLMFLQDKMVVLSGIVG